MAIRAVFPTLFYQAPLQKRGARELNRRLLGEIRQLQHDDAAGRQWSRKNYPGGFTSYGSVNRLHAVSPTFGVLERQLADHVKAFCRKLDLNLPTRKLVMTDCWANVMPTGVVHGLHLHPLSTISGTYYVRIPAQAPGLKFEDPRLDRMMAAPRRRAWELIPVKEGDVVLFESWLRHEVPANTARAQRITISFNFNWF
ncbi:MAG TPA: TIGR02466 family protein [Steroidobacteraceae bacterium]|jgi:uncharacterized protein (TIGR02466 family)|nr:TIGR02466 family protein [Steroidobacteraceae bacterium]